MSFTIKDINISIERIREAQAYLTRKRFFYRFHKKLEAQYTKHMLLSYQFENRLYPLLGALGLVLFLAADHLVMPELFNEAVIIRSAGASVILLIVAYLYYHPASKWDQLLLCSGSLITHLSLVLVSILAANNGHYHYQLGSMITIFFISNIIRVGFSYALPFALLMFISQIYAMTSLVNISTEQTVEIYFLFTFVTCLSLLVNARMDFEMRKNFLRWLLLDHEQGELIKTQEELRKLSISDTLTGLYNRRYFNKHIEREWLIAARQKSDISVLMIDVDDFKRYNDTQGHLAGDDALSCIGRALQKCIQRPSDLVARYGGEEFVVTLPYSDAKAAMSMATKILAAVYELNIQHPHASHKDRLTISIGCCSLIPDQEQSIKDLLKCADDALYESKHKGKNCISMGKCGTLN